MRTIKMLVLGISVAAAALALLGTGSAFASELCKAAETPCAEANVIAEGTGITAKASKPVFTTSLGNVTCASSTSKVETSTEAGAPLPAYVTELSFSECTFGGSKCTVSTLHLPYYAMLDRTGTDIGTLTIRDSGEGKPSAKVECGGFIKCTVGTEEMVLDVKGGSPATIEAKEESLSTEGALCPKTVSFTATYSVEAPAALHIQPDTTKLCKVAPNGAGECPAGEGFAGAIKTELLSPDAKFKSAIGTVSCEETTLTGVNFVEAGTGSINGMTFETAGGVCNSTLANEPGVKVEITNLPLARSSFAFRSATRALLIAAGNNQPPLKFTIELPTAQTCRYRASRASWVVFAYNPMKIKSAWLGVALAGNGAACPVTVTLEAELNVKRSADNGNLWVTK
jgi:hypothetical protein